MSEAPDKISILEIKSCRLAEAPAVDLARSVYRRNDARAALKRGINLALGSDLIEEKSYPDYGEAPPG